MDFEISGLPLHILIVHATVIIVPLAALCVLLSAFSIKIRHKLGIITPILATISLILVPVTQAAGSWLMERIDATALIAKHMNFGQMVLPWVIGLFLVAVGQWLWHRKEEKRRQTHADSNQTDAAENHHGQKKNKILSILGMTLAAIVSLGSIYSIYQAGESGSRAVWENAYQKDSNS